jgi:sugar lactone lactonase YvrE
MAGSWPSRLELPNGSQPEGIAAGKGRTLYVGSIPTGAVYELDAKTGKRGLAVNPAEGRAAIGLKFDGRRDRLFVAGGPTGKAFVYDEETGGLLKEFQLTDPAAGTFINDVALSKHAAYFTDSRQPTIYAVDRGRKLEGFKAIRLTGFPLVAGQFNLNGIEATRNGRWLLAVQSVTGDLWRIDPTTGEQTKVTLDGYSLTGGDGLLLHGSKKLYVVQNQLNKIAVLKLSKSYTQGRLVDTLTHPELDVPTTIARKGGALYAVNARFGTPDADTAPYWVTRVEK